MAATESPLLTGTERPPESAEELEAAFAKAKVTAALVGETDVRDLPRIGRFVLLARLGEGGMGVVWAAFDPDLDRRVAIKLLRHERDDVRHRLVREAQAMARLTHPNIAAIHEVGCHAGRWYVAMEFVRGHTLRQWQTIARRSWREVVAAYVQAGRGLATAHAIGIVHRDFKPDNAILGLDGRVRVVDFGLARRTEMPDPEAEQTIGDIGLPHPEVDGPPSSLTETGQIVGTPAYMAPEQFHRRPADARTDQFAFCVALWEALWHERPFAGETQVEIVANVISGRMREVPRGRDVPHWLLATVRRGLAIDPGDRFASMDALLEVLASDRRRTWVRRGVIALGVSAVAVAGAAGWNELSLRARTDACVEDGESIAQVWNDTRRNGLRAAVVSMGTGDAEPIAERIVGSLDAYARTWQDARAQACLATSVDETMTAETFERATWCLHDRQLVFAALVTELESGAPEALQRGAAVVPTLPEVDACLDPDALSRLPVPPSERAPALATARAELARALALQWTGRYTEGLAAARNALTAAREIGWPPFIASAELRVGYLLSLTGDKEAAEATIESAYFTAVSSDAVEVGARSADRLAQLLGMWGRPEEGFRWAHHAELLWAQLPDPDGLREAKHLEAVAVLHAEAGDAAASKVARERALEIYERALGPDHLLVAGGLRGLAAANMALGQFEPARSQYARSLAIEESWAAPDDPMIASSLDGLAGANSRLGHHEEAKALYERALDIRERAFGPDHLETAHVLIGLGNNAFQMRAFADARAAYERALAIREKAWGPDHIRVAHSLDLVAGVLQATGDAAQAVPLHERALRIAEREHGPDHAMTATIVNNLAEAHRKLGHRETAAELHERSLAIRERTLPPDHPNLAMALYNVGLSHYEAGDHAKADAMFQRCLAIREQALPSDHVQISYPLLGLAKIALARGDAFDAVAAAERALALREDVDGPGPIAEARAVLGMALWLVDDGRRDIARQLVEQARTTFESDGENDELAWVRGWLVEHPPGSG